MLYKFTVEGYVDRQDLGINLHSGYHDRRLKENLTDCGGGVLALHYNGILFSDLSPRRSIWTKDPRNHSLRL
jgi:hypothetical protein